jgi:hypothetical protein
MLEILFPPTEITGAREKRETTGAKMTTPEKATTVVFDSINSAPADNGPASTLTSMSVLPYATVIRTIPVESHVIVKLPLVEDWSEPKSTYPMRALAPAEAPESS